MVSKKVDKSRQKGVALITILLVVVIATVLGVSMVTEQKFAISRAQTSFGQTVARQYALGGEELARQILHQDAIDQSEVDHLGENWALAVSKFQFEDGEVIFNIEDLQAKFNLNSLVQRESGGKIIQQRFVTLLAEFALDRSYADRIIDWIDRNETVSPLGAESYDYLGLEKPYRSADNLMVDISELRLILELKKEQYQALSPFVTSLSNPATSINVNTISAQMMVALAPGLSLETAASIVSNRNDGNPYQSVADFTGDAALGDAANTIKIQGLSVQSNFFQVNIRARYQDRFANLTSIIQRDPVDGSMQVIYRNQSKRVVIEDTSKKSSQSNVSEQ